MAAQDRGKPLGCTAMALQARRAWSKVAATKRRTLAYVFDPQRLSQLAKVGNGLPFDQMVEAVIDALAREYPGHIETKQDWIYNLTGGAIGLMTVLHGSFSEYLILFGSPIGTSGFSGRYHLDIYDDVICGEMRTFNDREPEKYSLFMPGEQGFLPKGTVKGYTITPGTWMLEYGRGPVATALPMGLIEAALVALDGTTVYKTIRNYTRLVLRSAMKGKF